MSTNRFLTSKLKKKFEKFVDKTVINRIGSQSRFAQRKSKKISAFDFVVGFICSCRKGAFSFNEWALQITMLSGCKVSKQAVFERLNSPAVRFAQQLVEQVLIQKIKKIKPGSLFPSFRRVLLQESTNLGLHKSLSAIFTGSSNKAGKNATARVQTIFDILSMGFIDFSLGSFKQNDQSASGSILTIVKKGDLLIRDLGYFSISVFEKLRKKEVYFLSRLRYGVTITDKQEEPILLKELLKGKITDRWVNIGSKKKAWVRLLIIPVPQVGAAEKIRKAKQDRDKRLNHNREYYEWLRYNVYITSLSEKVWTPEEVFKAYQTRWQIEIIFKSWKSGCNLQEILHPVTVNENRVRVSIWLILLFSCLFMQKIYLHYRDKISTWYGKQISILKLSVYVFKHFKDVIAMPDKVLKEFLISYCCYETRSDRVNMTDLYQQT
jgi:Transposase DDE domain